MTRKDYVLLADAFSECRPYVAARSTREQRACFDTWHNCRAAVMEVLKQDNPNFNRAKFVEATEK
jgi:hypothetical protein